MNDSTPIINLAPLLRHSGDVSTSGELSELRYEQNGKEHHMRFTQPSPYRIDVNTLGGNEMWLSGRFQPTLEMECARCLRPVETSLDFKLGTLMRFDPSVQEPHIDENEEGAEVLVFGEPQIDLSAFLSEITLVGGPLSVLHDPNCKGLCMVCGTDLNEATCEHGHAVPTLKEDEAPAELRESPFAALRGLKLPEE